MARRHSITSPSPLVSLPSAGRGAGAATLADKLAEIDSFLRGPFDQVLEAVAREFGFTRADLLGVKHASLAARKTALMLAVEHLKPVTIVTIARWFGVGDATIYRAIQQTRAALPGDPELAARVARLRESIKEIPNPARRKITEGKIKTSKDAHGPRVARDMARPGAGVEEPEPRTGENA